MSGAAPGAAHRQRATRINASAEIHSVGLWRNRAIVERYVADLLRVDGTIRGERCRAWMARFADDLRRIGVSQREASREGDRMRQAIYARLSAASDSGGDVA